MKHWNISYGKNGFLFNAYESRRIGRVMEWVLVHDLDWWGEYKNIPFCLINPWGWTFKIGTKDKSLGTLWMDFGQWLHQIAWRLSKEQIMFRVVLTDEQAEKIDPQFFHDMKELDLDEKEETDA